MSRLNSFCNGHPAQNSEWALNSRAQQSMDTITNRFGAGGPAWVIVDGAEEGD
ncbi:hypothetical protein AMATHDRAFT_70162 [Amanita thiersii Skay4041]|uniref:Uncharacterized protein n=1 Tax=Amanita thiersii Skay4041 TaxID=703135 RepID=A0A2A9N7W8_9AGAR|nr:hypothetical protein AMATHDRAFT_70162 [Amanita thiersii Skay4041]